MPDDDRAAVGVDRLAWAQWPGLAAPDGVRVISADLAALAPEVLSRIEFYVPHYMSGDTGLWPTRQMPRLQVLQVPNAGYDDAIEYLRPGVTLCNARGVHDESTAELAVALTLASRRGLMKFADAQRAGHWRRSLEPAFTDSAVAVVGHGSIGRVLVRMLAGFSVTVTPFSRHGTGGARPIEDLPALLGTFDVVILMVPLTAETTRMVDAAFLGAMRDGALLVNVSRGAVVDTEALLAELTSGRLHAALDVTDPEPLPDGHPLWAAPNCIITPHVGGSTSAFEPRIRALIEEQLARWARGDELMNVVARG